MTITLISESTEMRPCLKTRNKTKHKPAVYKKHLTKKEVYSDKGIRWTCKKPGCGRRSYTIFVKASNRKKQDSPDWLKTWQRK